MHDERTDPSMYHSTEAWFVRHRLYPERTKTFVFGFVFVFVLAHEHPITINTSIARVAFNQLHVIGEGLVFLHAGFN